MRTDPERAVYQLLESKIRPVKEALDELQRQAASIKDAELESALAHENSDVRYVTATILLDRGRLSEGIANALLTDSSSDVVAVAIQALIELRLPLSVERIRKLMMREDRTRTLAWVLPRISSDDLVYRWLNSLPPKTVRQHAIWHYTEGPAAYEVVGRGDFKRWAETIRFDVGDRFANFRDQANIELRKSLLGGKEAAPGSITDESKKRIEGVLQKWTELDESIGARFVAAGLRVLKDHGEPSDIKLARLFSQSQDYGIMRVVVELLGQWGDSSDAQRLIAAAKSSYGEVAQAAARFAIRLADDPAGRILEFLGSGIHALAHAAVGILNDDVSMALPKDIESFLAADDAAVRLGVATALVARWDSEQLSGLLDLYIDRPKYYYNVVAEIDRALYASKQWR